MSSASCAQFIGEPDFWLEMHRQVESSSMTGAIAAL